jgi:hypothetical protein
MQRALLPILALVFLLAACERSSMVDPKAIPDPEPLRAARADLAFRLTPAERSTIRRSFDVDALERLLGMLTPDARKAYLPYFQFSTEPGEVTSLIQIGDLELQAVLEEVWAPHWSTFTVEAMDREPAEIPGRAAARRRGLYLRSKPR